MKWIADINHPRLLHCEIEQQYLRSLMNHPDAVEFWLCVLENGEEIYDIHQDTLGVAKRVAFEKFQVPLTAWRQVK